MRVNYQANATPRLQVLSNDQIEQIVYAAMEILQTTGTCVYQDEALELGAKIPSARYGCIEVRPIADE